ncbi:MAG: dockerin type I repeat-containing protein [Lachnospirales bacterium]
MKIGLLYGPKKWNDLNDNNIYEQSGFICEWDDTELNNIYKMTVFDNDGNTLDGVVVSVDNISSTSDTNGTTVFNKNVMDNEIVNVRVTREGYYTYLDTININDTNELQVNLLKPDEVEKGDVSGNGVINNSDVVYMLKGSAGILQFDDYQLNTADITGDGIFNMQDIIAVINIVQ